MIEGDIRSKERKVLADKIIALFDINPKNWLKPFQRKNFFYHNVWIASIAAIGGATMFVFSNRKAKKDLDQG